MLQIPGFSTSHFKVRMGMQTLKKHGTAQSRAMLKKRKSHMGSTKISFQENV